MGWGWRRSSSSRGSSYRAPSSNRKDLTSEEASGPGFSDAVWYSTKTVKSKFGLTTDNLRTITGYRAAKKHYGGGNNLTLYRERDILMFMDRRAGKAPQTAAAIEERRLQFRKQQADQAQAVRDRADRSSGPCRSQFGRAGDETWQPPNRPPSSDGSLLRERWRPCRGAEEGLSRASD